MAFQQKKKKKKGRSKKSANTVCEADTSIRSEPPGLSGEAAGMLDSLGGNESPIPWDEFEHSSLEDSLPVDPMSRLSTSLPIVSYFLESVFCCVYM